MNDDELRAAAEEVARVLGLRCKVLRCASCGNSAAPHEFIADNKAKLMCPLCGYTHYSGEPVEIETSLNLLTEDGAARLLAVLWRRFGVEFDDGFVNLQLFREEYMAVGKGDTWQAALVNAAHGALRAGWLAEEGGDG